MGCILENKENETIENLVYDLSDMFLLDDIGLYAKRTAKELTTTWDKVKKFRIILDQKMEKDEISYIRFKDSVEQVFFNIVDNCCIIKNKLDVLKSIDISFFNDRILEIKVSSIKTKEMLYELSSLRSRRNIVKESIKMIEGILSINEATITSIDKMILSIGEINSKNAMASIDMSYSVEELEKLIENSKLYNRVE